jgi:hypothetical protein
MKLKHTVILIVLAAPSALMSILSIGRCRRPRSAEEKKGRLFDFDRDKITAIAIKTRRAKSRYPRRAELACRRTGQGSR